MNYKPYATSKTQPHRLNRKTGRRETFLFNANAKKLQRKAERKARKEANV